MVRLILRRGEGIDAVASGRADNYVVYNEESMDIFLVEVEVG